MYTHTCCAHRSRTVVKEGSRVVVQVGYGHVTRLV